MRRRLRRAGRLVGIVLLALVTASAVAAGLYDVVTTGGRPARELYAGPYVTVDGRSLAYRRWGTGGSPIVLLGGFVEPSDVWRKVGPLLARAHHRVFALDLPPFGYSERQGPYGLTAWLPELEGFERALGISRPVVVGHSLGAATAVGEALRRPRALRGIVLLDGDALKISGGPRWLAHLVVDPWYTALYRFLTRSDWLVRRVLRNAYGPNPPRLDRAELDRWERPFRVAGTAAAFKELVRGGIPGWTLADLRRVHGVRALVVWGADDRVDDVAAGRRSARALGAPFILLPAAGHLSMLDDPRGVAAAIGRLAGSG